MHDVSERNARDSDWHFIAAEKSSLPDCPLLVHPVCHGKLAVLLSLLSATFIALPLAKLTTALKPNRLTLPRAFVLSFCLDKTAHFAQKH